MCIPTEGRTREGRGVRWETEKIIRFITFKIQNGRNGGLELALLDMTQGWVYCGVIQEKNLTKVVYTREASVFWLLVTEAPSAHRGGSVIFYRKAEHLAIEELRLHGPDVIIFQIVRGRGGSCILWGCIFPPATPRP